jgi:predicted metal-dependent hydrolase
VQLQLFLNPGPAKEVSDDVLVVNGTTLPLQLVRNPRARRYVLRLGHDGIVRVTVPRGGSGAEARRVAHRHLAWLEKQLQKRRDEAGRDHAWRHGTEIFLRGEPTRIEVRDGDSIRLVHCGELEFATDAVIADLRPALERQLWKLARLELPPRTRELAVRHGLEVRAVSVRNQRSRWGSCSRSATVSLNWRLVQMPAAVSDYIILHELAHLRVMNHSAKYWRVVAQLCPDYRAAEAWLKAHGRQLQWVPARGGRL